MLSSSMSSSCLFSCCYFFFFNDTATTEIYTLSLHDALPICAVVIFSATSTDLVDGTKAAVCAPAWGSTFPVGAKIGRATSELQSHSDLVCRLLLEKKKKKTNRSEIDKIEKELTA